MEIKILQVFYGKDGLPYKDKNRQVHFPNVGTSFIGASNTTQIKFYYEELDNLDETTWVAVSKLPNGKIGSKVLESHLDSELNEHYALLELDNYYTQYKGDVFISLQGYQGGVNLDFNEETEQYEIHGTPTIAATGSIRLGINYATQFIGSGETENITLQRILAELGTKLGIRAYSEHVEELPDVGNSNIFYVVNDDPRQPTKANIYIWNSVTQHYVWVGDNTLDLGDYYTRYEGESFELLVSGKVNTIESELQSIASGSPRGVYATASDLESDDPDHDYIYLVQADNKWYYWADNEWNAGGTYLSASPDSAFDLSGNNSIKNALVTDSIKATVYDALKNKCYFNNGSWTSSGETNFAAMARACSTRWVQADRDMRFIAASGYQISLCVSSNGGTTVARNYTFQSTDDKVVYKGEYFVFTIRSASESSAYTYEDIFPKLKAAYVITEPLTRNEQEYTYLSSIKFLTPNVYPYSAFISTGNNPSYPIGSVNASESYKTTDLILLEANKTYVIYGSGTINTAILSKWQINQSNPGAYPPAYTWVENLVVDDSGVDSMKFFEYTPTENCFVRICTKAEDVGKTHLFEKNDAFEMCVNKIITSISQDVDSAFDPTSQKPLENQLITNKDRVNVYDALKDVCFFINGSFNSSGNKLLSITARVCTLNFTLATKDLHFISINPRYQVNLLVSTTNDSSGLIRTYSYESTADKVVYKGEYFVLVIRDTQEHDIYETFGDISTFISNVYVLSEPELAIDKDTVQKANINFFTPPFKAYSGFIATSNSVYTPGTFVSDANYEVSDMFLLKGGKTYIIYAFSSPNCAVLSKWQPKTPVSPNQAEYTWVENLVVGGGDGKYFYEYTPENDVFVRLGNRKGTVANSQIFEKNDAFDIAFTYSLSKTQSIPANPSLIGKKINVIGDSYVAGNGNVGNTWHYKMAQKYGMTYRNYGINGNGLITPNRTGTPVVSRYTDMDNDADIVVVIGGKNDFNDQYPLADFKSGLETLCAGLIAKYPTKRILFFTPWRVPMSTIIECDPSLSSFTIPLVDYCDAIVEICKKYMIPVFDTKDSAMFLTDSTFRTTFMQSSTDISHTNNAGGARFEVLGENFVGKNI